MAAGLRSFTRQAPSRRLSSTDMSANICRPSGTWALGPSTVIVPDATGITPLIALTIDDLPAPLGPTRATISPFSTETLTPSTAVAVP